MVTTQADWPKTLEWIEKQAQESLKARFQTADLVAKETQTTLTVLLAAIGGSAAYGAKIFDGSPAGPPELAAAFTCLYFVVLAVILVLLCMMFVSYPALYQDPTNLLQPTYSLNQIREAELKNIQDRIIEAASINAKRAKSLNRIRIATALSPFIFALIALMSPSKQALVSSPSKIACQIAPLTSTPTFARIECEMVK